MRTSLIFECQGATLVGTLDRAPGSCGLLIVSGGNEIRSGAHRGMAQLAGHIAKSGYPVFRFDRRGIGDSEGDNRGFESSGPDIASAIAAFRDACPALQHIIAFGNCDAAAALVLHARESVDGLVLANVWTIEGESDLPPPAAIKARYLQQVRDPKTWLRLMSGGINLRKLASGLARVVRPGPAPLENGLVARLGAALASCARPVSILLARGDATAIAFADSWSKPAFATARGNAHITLQTLDSASHSFAKEEDYSTLLRVLVKQLEAGQA